MLPSQPDVDFRQRLVRMDPKNTDQVKEMTRFASKHHRIYAKQIAQELISHIYQTGEEQKPFINLFDSILKHVQGNYIAYLKPKASTVFQVSFMNAKGDAERKTLVKMVKIWDLFISRRHLQPVLESTDFQKAYQRLLSAEDKRIISNYKHSFKPLCLPESLE